MSKVKFFLLALVALFFAATVSADVVWSSAFDFDGTPTSVPIEIDVDTPIFYSTYLADNLNANPLSVTITATSQQHSVFVADIFYTENMSQDGATGTAVWNFKDADYDTYPKKDTYTLQEVIKTDVSLTTLTRPITLVPEPTLIVVLGVIGALLMRRRIKGVLALLLLVTIGSFDAWAGGTITSVTCQQAWPISRKVLITCSFTADSRQAINFYGTTDNGETTFELSDRGTLIGASSIFSMDGTQTVVWEPDETLDSVKGKIKIGAEIGEPNYLVVDLSGGSTAIRYPYRYIPSVPPGGWSDTYKTTKMVLKLVPAGTFSMGSPSGELGRSPSSEYQHSVTLTKSFYVGVFEVTQKQYEQIIGSNPSMYKGDTRPVDSVSYNDIRGTEDGCYWPEEDTVDNDSFLGIFRRKCSNLKFDLPTEAQWEYACRASTVTALNSGENLTVAYDAPCPKLNKVGRNLYNTNDGKGDSSYDKHTAVGCYLPNNWGLYDMHGNVSEWCLDWFAMNLGTSAVTDPVGPNSSVFGRTTRGGNYSGEPEACRSASRGASSAGQGINSVGFRLVLVP